VAAWRYVVSAEACFGGRGRAVGEAGEVRARALGVAAGPKAQPIAGLGLAHSHVDQAQGAELLCACASAARRSTAAWVWWQPLEADLSRYGCRAAVFGQPDCPGAPLVQLWGRTGGWDGWSGAGRPDMAGGRCFTRVRGGVYEGTAAVLYVCV
jgi:hypothetical protein